MGSEPPEGTYSGASTGGRHPDSDLRRSTSVVLDDKEKRNMRVFILGTMFYKLGFEGLNTCVALLAADRFPKHYAITIMSVLLACFAAEQSFTSFGGAYLLAKYPPQKLLAGAMWVFAVLASGLLVLEAATGGTFTTNGRWSPYLIFPLYIAMGGCIGIFGLIRRTLPTDIVGTEPAKLQHMDASVHIFYMMAGTVGAFVSAPLIAHLGYVFALSIMPPAFVIAGACYYSLDVEEGKGVTTAHAQRVREEEARMMVAAAEPLDGPPILREMRSSNRKSMTAVRMAHGHFKVYLMSMRVGVRILLSDVKYAWLIFGYMLPLVLHRLLEYVIYPSFAKMVLEKGAYAGLMLGVSNLGELCGALVVLMFGSRIKTPLPYVRWDAVAMCLCWVFADIRVGTPLSKAVVLLPIILFVSCGWAAGDVSLLAYIQANISRDHGDVVDGVSCLGAVVSTLYSGYILAYALLSIAVGQAFDHFRVAGHIERGFFWVTGVLLSCCAVLVFGSTLLTGSAWSCNPPLHEDTADPDDELMRKEMPPIPDPVEEGPGEKDGHHPKSHMRRQWEAAHAHDRQIMEVQQQHDEEEVRRDYRRRAASCFTTQNGCNVETAAYRLWITPVP